MARRTYYTPTFLAILLGCIIACTVGWQELVVDRLYHCTDAGIPADFLLPSSAWVHGDVVGEPGKTGDTIAPGWSIDGLICLRWALMFGSIAASAGVARRVSRRDGVGTAAPG